MHLHIETPEVEAFLAALKPALVSYMQFNGGDNTVVQKISHDHQQVDATTQQQWQSILLD